MVAVAAADPRPKEIQAKWDQEKRNANILIGSEKNRETIGAIFYLIILVSYVGFRHLAVAQNL